jgi:uncharacterized protein (TIGR01777 family)
MSKFRRGKGSKLRQVASEGEPDHVQAMAKTILLSGSSGLIGTALAPALETMGHRVIRLVRHDTRRTSDIRWSPSAHLLDERALADVDVIVNLSGETIGRRWTATRRRRIRSSRIDATDAIVTAMSKAEPRPRTLICASAVGYYGDRGNDVLDEQQPNGRGFLADICRQWETSASFARRTSARVVMMRSGVVLSKKGGALKQMLPPFRMGVGGRLGSGRQWMSWITLGDMVRAIAWLIDHEEISGPVNMCAPNPVQNSEFTHALGTELHRPTIFPVPSFALWLLFGEMAGETLLASQRAVPSVLTSSGFQFESPAIDQALAQVL